jgi:hypothetical protein
MTAQVGGPGPDEMRLLAVRIRSADPVLKAELRKNMKAAAGPLVAKVQQSILDMPSKHAGGLRKDVARTVTSQLSVQKTGVHLAIVSYGTRMPEGMTNLPALMDAPTGWGHPVFERRLRRRFRREWTWVRQRGKPGWFEDTISGEAKALRQAAQDAMDATARKIGS